MPQPTYADYQSYLLRLWCEQAGGPWRATLHCVATGKQFGFADLDGLHTFLQMKTRGEDMHPCPDSFSRPSQGSQAENALDSGRI